MNKRIIVSRYTEDLSYLNKISDIEIFVYNKGPELHNSRFAKIQSIPNVGREGETYLRYIIENYNNLAEHNIFIQGNPFDHYREHMFENVLKEDIGDTTKILCIELYSCDQEGHPNHPGLELVSTFKRLNIKDVELPIEFIFGPGAQMIVPKSKILSKSLEWWNNTYDVFMSTPQNAWVFERLWPYIFEK